MMNEYDKKIENIISDLDSIEEGVFSKIGQAIKGLGQGIGRTDSDNEQEKKITGSKTSKEKGFEDYLATSGSDALKTATAGSPEYYQIGKNKVLEIDKLLQVFFHFEIDKEKQKKGNIVYVANPEKAFKRNPQLEWLFKGDYECKSLSLSSNSIKGRGTVRGKAILFTGNWNGGAFMGVLKNGEINGGQIIDGYYIAKSEGFKIKPWDFKSGGMSVASGFAFGLRLAKDNTNHKSLSLVQVPSNKIIKIIDNADKEHLINMNKGVDYKSLNMKINDSEVSWENYNKSEGDFKNTYMTVGSKFSIPGVIDISKGIQSIEIKNKEYEDGEGSGESTEKSGKSTEKEKSSTDNKFDIKSKVAGWTPGGRGYYVLDIDASDSDLTSSINRYKNDINSGKYFKYLKYFKSLVDDGRIDGFGTNPELAFLFPKKKGESFKDPDAKRDQTLKYFGRFREDVIDNFQSDKIGDYYKKLIKKQIEDSEVSGTKAKSKVKTKGKASVSKTKRAAKAKLKSESNSLSLSKILREVLESQ